jgi:hypothetical protein
MNIFDQLQDNAFDLVSSTIGYSATWLPKAGGPSKTARVLYNDPSEKQESANVSYEVEAPFIEWKKGDFEGLAEATQINNMEVLDVTVKGVVVRMIVKALKKLFDGGTYKAYVEIV